MDHSEQDDYFLDISDEACPFTFIKTKLFLEKITTGAIINVRLRGATPFHNVRLSVEELGHTIISYHFDHSAPPEEGIHVLSIKRS